MTEVCRPGEWNRRQQNGFDVRKVINVPTPLTVQRIREKCRLAVTVPVEEEEGQEEQEEEIGPRKEKRSEDVMQDETEGRLLPKVCSHSGEHTIDVSFICLRTIL